MQQRDMPLWGRVASQSFSCSFLCLSVELEPSLLSFHKERADPVSCGARQLLQHPKRPWRMQQTLTACTVRRRTAALGLWHPKSRQTRKTSRSDSGDCEVCDRFEAPMHRDPENQNAQVRSAVGSPSRGSDSVNANGMPSWRPT